MKNHQDTSMEKNPDLLVFWVFFHEEWDYLFIPYHTLSQNERIKLALGWQQLFEYGKGVPAYITYKKEI